MPTPDPSQSLKKPNSHADATSHLERQAPGAVPQKVFPAGDVDMTVLLEGAEDWDWVTRRLILEISYQEKTMRVILRDDWTTIHIRSGDITVNAVGSFNLATTSLSITLSITITAKSNLLILHPELITATALSNSPQCWRKPLLSTLLVLPTLAVPPTRVVPPTTLHPLLVDEEIDKVILEGFNELVKFDVMIDEAKREVMTRDKGLLAFSE
ncbi:hypothetical protein DXG01_002858 [Tephrocybe rancida]|nr:hypothetical protein DXG01_002858 [Tephrocybe rancida]